MAAIGTGRGASADDATVAEPAPEVFMLADDRTVVALVRGADGELARAVPAWPADAPSPLKTGGSAR